MFPDSLRALAASTRRRLAPALGVAALGLLALAGCDADDGDDGPAALNLRNYTSTDPFIKLKMSGVQVYPLLSSADGLPGTTGDPNANPETSDYILGGSPDGAGLLKNPDGTYTYLTNNEDNYSISKITLSETFEPIGGEYLVDSDHGRFRLCSATLCTPEEHGFGPVFLSAGESGRESMIHRVDPYGGLNESRLLPALGKHSTENAVPLPQSAYPGETVVLIGEDESGPLGGQIHLYRADGVGNLNSGSLYALARTDDNIRETAMEVGQTYDVEFRDVGNQRTLSGEELSQVSVEELSAVAFGRIEDLDYRKTDDGREVYFNVTGYAWGDNADGSQNTVFGRTYRLSLDDGDPLRGTLEVVLDGDVRDANGTFQGVDRSSCDENNPTAADCFQNPDNILVTENYVYVQEDPNKYGQESHDAYIYQYEIATGNLEVVAEVVPLRGQEGPGGELLAPADAPLGSWETGAMIDVSDTVGREGTFMLNVQAHEWNSEDFQAPDGGDTRADEREGGQVLVLTGLPR